MKLIKSLVCISVISALAACGGGGDTAPVEETVIPPVVVEQDDGNMIIVDNVGLSGGEGVVLFNSGITKIARSAGTAKAATSSSKAYKILSDGTLDIIGLTDSANKAVDGSVSLIRAVDIGHGWSVVSLKVSDVRLLNIEAQKSATELQTQFGDIENTYLVNNETGKSYLANEMGTPTFKYAGEDSLFVEGKMDAYVSTSLELEEIDNMFSSVRFDSQGDLFFVSNIIDTTDFDKDFEVKTKQALIKLNTGSLKGSDPLEVTEYGFDDSLDFHTLNVSGDGLHASYFDGGYKFLELSTGFVGELRTTDNLAFDLVFNATDSVMYGLDTKSDDSRGVRMYKLTFSLGNVEVELLNESDAENPTEFGYPNTSGDTFTVNGRTIIGENGSYYIFDTQLESFVDGINLFRAEDWVASEAVAFDSIFALIKRDYSVDTEEGAYTEVVRWTPNQTRSINETVKVLDIDPSIFKIKSFDVLERNKIAFEASLLIDFGDYKANTNVLAQKDINSDEAPVVLEVLSSNNIELLEGISKGGIIIDGYANEWSKDLRIITDETGDVSGSGDIEAVSITENDNYYWIMVESASFLYDTSVELKLSDSKYIKAYQDKAYFISDGGEMYLEDIGGTFKLSDNGLEVLIPKVLVGDDDLLVGVNTYVENIKGKAHIAHGNFDAIGNVLVVVDITSMPESGPLEIELFGNVIVNVDKSGDVYSAAINSADIESLGGSLVADTYTEEELEHMTWETINLSIPLSSIGDTYINKKVNATIVSKLNILQDVLIDEAKQ